MIRLSRGRYSARRAEGPADIEAAQRLRALAFHGDAAHRDSDAFDPLCEHVLVEESRGGRLVGCFRMLPLRNGGAIHDSYSAQYYDLSALAAFPGRMVEIGRFCIRPGLTDPDILRLAWGAMTAHVDAEGVEMLFGCASFAGTDPAPYEAAFALLGARHRAPARWLPRIKAPEVVRFAGREPEPPDRNACNAAPRGAGALVPPLLRSYLAMGGWVSDHAVLDRQMNTLHVFTAVEIAAIPPARKRLLRAVAGQGA